MKLVNAEEVRQIFDFEVAQCATDLFDAFDSAIENATAVDAAPVVHGRWMIAGRGIRACSECNHGIREHMACVNHYCPNCGAKMDGDGNDV